jgi:hypothetical protein
MGWVGNPGPDLSRRARERGRQMGWLLLLRALLVYWVQAAGTPANGADWRGEWELPEGFTMRIDTEEFDAPTAMSRIPVRMRSRLATS